MIREIADGEEKRRICRTVLEALPEWFGIVSAREKYIEDCTLEGFLAAYIEEKTVGFLSLKKTGDVTAEIAVMGVLPEVHRKGTGKALVEAAVQKLREDGFLFLQVKTVVEGMYENYDKTNQFYRNAGFHEFEIIRDLWDENNPCQIYVRYLR